MDRVSAQVTERALRAFGFVFLDSSTTMGIRSFLFRRTFFPLRKRKLDNLKLLAVCAAAQEKTLRGLVRRARRTRFGLDHQFSSVRSISDYQKKVPLRTYENFIEEYFFPASAHASKCFDTPYDKAQASPYLEDVAWPGLVRFFSLSSGTTAGATKFLPLTDELMRANFLAALDIATFHFSRRSTSRILDGKTFFLSGNMVLREDWRGKIQSGDLSGIAAAKAPWFSRAMRFPPKEIASISDWEEKTKQAAQLAIRTDIRAIGGVPSWVLLFLEKLHAESPVKGNIKRFWPNFELFIHGGISFEPYREQFSTWFGPGVDSLEVYPASEAFIAIEDPAERALRLMADYGTFYEFVPLAELGTSSPNRLTLREVDTETNYAIVLTTNGGLWSYVLGDTVRFLSKEPPLIKITGRTKFFLSAFGEHVIQEEIENALEKSCAAFGAHLAEYHIAPFFPSKNMTAGRHQFLIEFETLPSNLARFARLYDQILQKLNEDYAAHRQRGFGMAEPEFIIAPAGFFNRWMKAKGKLGGQHKVPRISGNRELMDEMLRSLKK